MSALQRIESVKAETEAVTDTETGRFTVHTIDDGGQSREWNFEASFEQIEKLAAALGRILEKRKS